MERNLWDRAVLDWREMGKKKITICGVEYESCKEAATKNGIGETTLNQRLRRGIPEDQLLLPAKSNAERLGKPITINGVTYESYSEAERRNGLKPNTIKRRLNAGWDENTLLDALWHGRSFEYNGAIYPSIREASRQTGVPYSKLKAQSNTKRRRTQIAKLRAEGKLKDISFEFKGKVFENWISCGRFLFDEEQSQRFAQNAAEINGKIPEITRSEAAALAEKYIRKKYRGSNGEIKTEKYLERQGYKFEKEVRLIDLRPDCQDLDGCDTHRRIDFVIYDGDSISFCVEYDGEQHFNPTNYDQKDMRKFIVRAKSDHVKEQFIFNTLQVPLLRIRWDQDVEETIQAFLKSPQFKTINPFMTYDEYWQDQTTVLQQLENKGYKPKPSKARISRIQDRTDHNGIVYATKGTMLKKYGISLSVYNRRINVLHWTKEKALTTPMQSRQKPVVQTLIVHGKPYSTYVAIAKDNAINTYGLKPRTIRARHAKGESLENALSRPSLKQVSIDVVCGDLGKITNDEKMNPYHLRYGTIHSRLKAGYSLKDALSKPLRKFGVECNGKHYNSLEELAHDCEANPLGISSSLLSERVRHGKTLEEALSYPSKTTPIPQVQMNGHTYNGYADLANDINVNLHGYSADLIRYRIAKLGWTPERAVLTPVQEHKSA